MGYNLLKSLYIKDNEGLMNELIDFTKVGCHLTFDAIVKSKEDYSFSVNLNFDYSPDKLKELKRKGKLAFSIESGEIRDTAFTINGSLKGTIRENGCLLKTFDNVIRIDNIYYIFQVDNFSLELSKELYSIPINIDDYDFSLSYLQCKRVCDFGIVNKSISKPLSVKDIALILLKSKDVVYRDGEQQYKITISDRGRALITKYKMANNL